jgi:hypothetical protein
VSQKLKDLLVRCTPSLGVVNITAPLTWSEAQELVLIAIQAAEVVEKYTMAAQAAGYPGAPPAMRPLQGLLHEMGAFDP